VTVTVGSDDADDADVEGAGVLDATSPEAIAAALTCAVVDGGSDDDRVVTALRWGVDVWGAGLDAAPLWLIHDLGYALLRGRAARFKGGRAVSGLAVFDDDAALLRAARLAYEDRVVAPWLAEPSFVAAHVIVAGLPAPLRDRAVAHALTLALERVVVGVGLRAGNVARLRAALERSSGPERVADAVTLARRATPRALAAVVQQLERVRGALGGQPLFLEEDLWELAHLQDLPGEGARLALRTVHATMARLPPPTPGLVARLRRRARDVAVDEATVDVFPAGGFDAMSTRGTFENLVRSEVAYVGEGRVTDARGLPTGPDLFDLRYVEGELLYYTRDESPLFEQRRALTLIVEHTDTLRHKVAALPAQTIVLALAVCLRVHRDLADVVGAAALQTAFALGGDDPAVVDEERALLATSLRADVAHRRVALIEPATAPLRGRVVLSPRPPPTAMREAPRQRPARLWVQVGGAQWLVDDGDEPALVDVSTGVGLRDVVDRILIAATR